MPRKSAHAKSRKTTAQVAVAVYRDQGLDTIVKAAELIRMKPARGKSLGTLASKCLNLMLGVAGGEGFADKIYSISKKELRRAHKGNERLPAILDELHRTLFKFDILSPDGRRAVMTVALLSSTIEELDDQDDALIYFRFTPEFMAVHKHSTLWAALSRREFMNFDSVYALRLYEIGCQMVGRYDPTMTLTVPALRELLHVPPGKYRDWTDLRRFTLDTAVSEVNRFAYFTVNVPENRIRRSGRKVVSLEIQFWKKEAAEEGESQSAGQKACREGKAVQVGDIDDLDLLWHRVCGLVEQDPAFTGRGVKNWLSKLKLIGIADRSAMLQAADKLAKDWVTRRLDQALLQAFADATGGKVTKIEVTAK